MSTGPLDRIARSARRVLRGEAGMVTLRAEDMIRFVGKDGVPIEEVPSSWAIIDELMGEDGYGFTECIHEDERLRGSAAFDAHPYLRSIFACEVPTPAGVGRSFLIVVSSKRMQTPDTRQILRVRELADLAADIITMPSPLSVPSLGPDVSPDDADVTSLAASMIQQAPFAGALLTGEGRFLFVNEAKAALTGVPVADHAGALVSEIAPQNEALCRDLIDRITRTGEPVLDEVIDIGDSVDPGHFRSFSVSAFPVCNDGSIVAFSTFMTDCTERRLKELNENASRGMNEERLDPAAEFLVSTLVRRETMRTRGKFSYLTCRAWRKSIKDSQIAALRALKRDAPMGLVATAADEILSLVRKTTGTSTFASVVPVPCGSSGTTDCLSARIGRAVAARMETECIEPFEPRLRGGSSHPRRNASLPPLKLHGRVSGPCLIVDDVVSSGRHIEQVSDALRDATSDQFRVAWIGP